MARQSKPFEVAWSSLASSPDADAGWRTMPLDAAGSIAIHAGRCFPENREAMLVRFPTLKIAASEKLPDGQGFSVERVDPKGDGHGWLALTRKPSGGAELFNTMACDVAGALDVGAAEGLGEIKAMRAFLGRVRAWQEFMRKGSQILSAEAEIGLAGELAVLGAIIEAGLAEHAAVEAWLGPLDGLQDFWLGTGAIEVKTTVSAVGFTARIMSLEQLDDSQRQPLFVAATRMRQVPAGSTLPEAVAAARAKVEADPEARRGLAERLIAAGYFDAHAPQYERKLELATIRAIEVGEEFPRLVRGNVPVGVAQVAYEIDLDQARGAASDLQSALKKLGAI